MRVANCKYLAGEHIKEGIPGLVLSLCDFVFCARAVDLSIGETFANFEEAMLTGKKCYNLCFQNWSGSTEEERVFWLPRFALSRCNRWSLI